MDNGKRDLRVRSPEARESQLVALAYDAAERMLKSDNPSASVVAQVLKLGTARERLEQKKIEYEIEYLKARKDAVESVQRIEELYSEAIKEMSVYNGQFVEEEDIDDEYDAI